MPLNTKTPLFADIEERLQEADQLLAEDKDPATNRAIISEFYAGGEIKTATEAAKDDSAGIINFLTGYDPMSQAVGQVFSVYTAAPDLWELEVMAGPELLRKEWQHRMTKAANLAIKKARTFKEEWRAAAGEMTLHGRAVLCYLNRWDLFPRCTQLYVPRGTGIRAEDLSYGVMPQRISLADLRRYEKRAEGDSRWNHEALKGAIKILEGQVGAGATTPTVTNNLGANRISPEEEALEDQEGGCGEWRTHLPVYFFYEVDHDDPMQPVTLTIVARYDANVQAAANKDQQVLQKALFHQKRHFANVRHWIHPFFVDCALGQTTTWHRTMGLGRLNYEPDVAVEEFMNEAMVGAKENARRLYRVADGADRESIARWMAEAANVMPEGVDIVEQSKNPNYQHIWQMMDRLQMLSNKNAGGQYSNHEGGNEELEIQALARQSRNARALGNRMNDIYESLDVLGAEVVRRLCYAVMRPTDRDYYCVQEFRQKMQEAQVPYKELARVNKGTYRYLKVKTSRAAGDGNDVQKRMNLQAMMAVRHMYSPQTQQKILRDFTAVQTGDYSTAEDYVPIQEQPDGNQVNRANNENDTCRLRGIDQYVPPINGDDLDLVHLPEHAGGMSALLKIGQVRGWQQDDLAAFMAIGSHAMMHVQQVQAIPEQKDIGNQWAQQIEGLARAGQEFANNLEEQSQQQQLSPLEQEKIMESRHKRAMAERQQMALEMHRDRETSLKEAKTAAQELTEFERLNQTDEQLDNQRLQMVLSARDRAENRAASRRNE